MSDNNEQSSVNLIASRVLKQFGEIGSEQESLAPVLDELLAVLTQSRPTEAAIRSVLEGQD